jgi:copper(I)-binding protein
MNMKSVAGRVRGIAIVAAVMAFGAVVAMAQEKPITATDAWIKLPDPGAKATEAYATVNNPGMYAIYLVSGTTDIAGKVEFRDASKGNAPQEDVTVIAYESTYMDPKGIHMYLSDLKRELKDGETVYITLKTEQGIPIEIEAKVEKP